MTFNSGSTTLSIVGKMNRICQTGNNSYPLVDKATDCNQALDRLWFLALISEGKWSLDDSNQTDMPSATTALNANQIDYSISTDMMVVEKVLVKDESGNWCELTPVDYSQSRTDSNARDILERPTGNTGIPTHYDIQASSILLNPVPSYTQAASLKVVFRRGPSYFISTDTTKSPGVPLIFHNFIPYFASLQFLMDKGNKRKNDIAAEVAQMEVSITEFYSKRNKNEPQKLTPIRRARR